MKTKYLTFIVIFIGESIFAQDKIINQFKEFVANADMTCYEQKIQQDLYNLDKWLIDSFPILNKYGRVTPYKPGNVDLQKERKIFVLAVSLYNTENYNFDDNIYDYLIIDSLRTFIAICVDEKMNVTGITDVDEPGTFYDLKDNFYYWSKKRRNQIRTMIKNINKENPDLLLFCESWDGSFLYIKGEKIYQYIVKTGKSIEFNKHIRECPDINLIRGSNRIGWPETKMFDVRYSFSSIYRYTGHTPPNEVRMCSH